MEVGDGDGRRGGRRRAAEKRKESEEKVWRKRSYRKVERRVEEESLIECVIKKIGCGGDGDDGGG